MELDENDCRFQSSGFYHHHLLLNPEWFDILVPAYPGCPRTLVIK